MIAAIIVFVFPLFGIAAENTLDASTTKSADTGSIFRFLGLTFLSTITTAIYFVCFIAARQIYLALTRNAIINTLHLEGGHRFASNLSGGKLAWITISNMAVVLFTSGLMQPWAATRLWRYQTSSYGATPGVPVDEFADEQREAVSAFGSEFGDIEGFNIGIGI